MRMERYKMVKFKNKEDKERFEFWDNRYPVDAKSKTWKPNTIIEDRGKPHRTLKVIAARLGRSASVYSGTGIGKPIIHSEIGKKRISIAVLEEDGTLAFGNPKDFKRKIKK